MKITNDNIDSIHVYYRFYKRLKDVSSYENIKIFIETVKLIATNHDLHQRNLRLKDKFKRLVMEYVNVDTTEGRLSVLERYKE